MKIQLRDAAALLGLSARAVRAQLARGVLRGEKRGRAWVLDVADLPLTEPQRASLERRAEGMRQAVEDALPARLERRRRSATDLDAFRAGRAVLVAMRAATPAPRGTRALEQALVDLAEAAHEYALAARAACLARARSRASRALGLLLLAEPRPAGADEWIAALEERVLPALGGLLRWVERRARAGARRQA